MKLFPLLLGLGLTLLHAALDHNPAPAAQDDPKARQDHNGDPLPQGAVARIGTTRFRHDDGIRSLAFSKDGKKLASGGVDRTVRLWDLATGKEMHRFNAPQFGCFAVVFSPDGKMLVAGGHGSNDEAGAIIFWDVATGKELRQIKQSETGRAAIWALAFSPDGKTLASANNNGTIFLLEADTGKPLRQLEGKHGAIEALAFSPDGNILACGAAKGIVLWDLAAGAELRQLGGEGQGGYWYIAFAPDGATLASGSVGTSAGGAAVRLWDVASGKEIRAFPEHQAVTFLQGGKTLATGGPQGVFLWEAATGKQLQQCFADTPQRGSPMGISARGDVLAVSIHRTIRLWDAAAGKELLPFQGHGDAVTQVALSPDGKSLTSASADYTIRTWDRAKGVESRRIKGEYRGHYLLSLDGKTAAVGSRHLLELRDVPTGKLLGKIGEPAYPVTYACLSADGKILAVRSLNETDSWEVATNKKVQSIKESGKPVAFSPDNRVLAVASHNRISLWDLDNGTEQVLFGHKESREHRRIYFPPVAFSKDGLVVTADFLTKRSRVSVWDVKTGKLRRQWPTSPWDSDRGDIESLALSPDQKTLAAGDWKGAIHLWDAAGTGQERGGFKGHQGAVQALTFSADGRLLISGSEDTTILVWDIKELKKKK